MCTEIHFWEKNKEDSIAVITKALYVLCVTVLTNRFSRNSEPNLQYNLEIFVRYNIMKCQTWLLVIEGSKTFVYLISKQKYLEKDCCRFVSHFH